jgi:hypothetical protein
MARYKQGLYNPKNPEKYIGDLKNINYRSGWELRFFQFADQNPNIIKWASEPFSIPYFHPIHQNTRQYWPDIYMEYKDRNGRAHKELIEIKPMKDAQRGKSRNPNQRLKEDVTYAINVAKWTSCKKWCDERKIKFRVVTENQLFK